MEMKPLNRDATDEDFLRVVEKWISILEQEDYDRALEWIPSCGYMHWTPKTLRGEIKDAGECKPDQKVTMDGESEFHRQTIHVSRWDLDEHGQCGEIWYTLNIDGQTTALTAYFRITENPEGLVLRLWDVRDFLLG